MCVCYGVLGSQNTGISSLLNHCIGEFSVLVSTQVAERGKWSDLDGGFENGVGSKRMRTKGIGQGRLAPRLREEGWQ